MAQEFNRLFAAWTAKRREVIALEATCEAQRRAGDAGGDDDLERRLAESRREADAMLAQAMGAFNQHIDDRKLREPGSGS